MAVIFDWKNEYAVGNDELDNQHKYLFRLGNDIQTAETGEAKTYVMELYTYTRKHFQLEENHMKIMGFPDREGHILLHNKLLSDLNTIAEDFNPSDSFEKLRIFYFTWLTNHILEQDKKYFNFFHKKSLI